MHCQGGQITIAMMKNGNKILAELWGSHARTQTSGTCAGLHMEFTIDEEPMGRKKGRMTNYGRGS